MDGKVPGPPQDWSDDETPPTKPTATAGDSSTDDDPDLDPAKLH
jgi:hypothetical protein